jgi:DEK C terminal domain
MACDGLARKSSTTVTRHNKEQVSALVFLLTHTLINFPPPFCLLVSVFIQRPTERDETERVIRTALKEIMMSVDLDEVTSKYIRGRLEEHLDMDLGEFKSFIDEEMLVILGQMDSPTEIFDHVYLGSEWNASNLEELQRNG